jgi:hypothetical protein
VLDELKSPCGTNFPEHPHIWDVAIAVRGERSDQSHGNAIGPGSLKAEGISSVYIGQIESWGIRLRRRQQEWQEDRSKDEHEHQPFHGQRPFSPNRGGG